MPKAKASGKSAKASTAPAAKKMKKEKDPNAPKRPLSAYFIFSNEIRPTVKKQNPDAKITDMSKIIGDMWKGMDDGKKAKYQKKADTDKERYEKEMAAYKKKQ